MAIKELDTSAQIIGVSSGKLVGLNLQADINNVIKTNLQGGKRSISPEQLWKIIDSNNSHLSINVNRDQVSRPYYNKLVFDGVMKRLGLEFNHLQEISMAIQSLAAAPSDRGLTDLSIIGVPESQFKRIPGVSGYPKKFNPEAQKVWTKMVQNEDFKKRCKQAASLDIAWHNAIQEFLHLCEETGVFPFINNADTTRNEFIQDFVRRGRMALVKFFDDNCIFERVKVRKAYRDYFRKDTGLIINSWAELYPVKDEEFMTWIQKAPAPRFVKHTENHYVKVVQPNVRAWVKYIHSGRIVIGFSIEVVGTITIPNKPNPKRKEVDKFIDDRIFLPTIRAHRFKGVTTRLF